MNESAPPPGPDPTSLGGYRVLGRLGEGGQGTVYLGEGPGGDRVAIKTLNTGAVDDPSMRQRFVREAEAARQVASFCTAAVLAADFDSHPPYIVSEFVEGLSLKQRVEDDGPFAPGDLNRLAVAMANALVAIHEAGIVHRDLKPANVLLGEGGARVIDFGIAQDTRGAGTLTNSTIGTPAFMAPEQIEGAPVSPATDVFAWGAVMVFAATGVSPFQGPSIPTILHQVLSVDPDVSGVPEPLRGPVAAALAKDPAARPASVDLLMGLLGRKERPAGHDAVTAVLRESAGPGAAAAGAAGAAAGAGAGAAEGGAPPSGAPEDPTTPTAAAPHGAADPTLHATAPAAPAAGHPAGPHGPGAGGAAPRRRTGALVTGAVAVVLLLLVTGTAAYLVGSNGGSGGEEPAAAPTPSESKAPELDKEKAAEHTGAAVPKFTEDFGGEWEGAVGDRVYTLDIEPGDRTAELSDDGSDNDSCDYEFEIREAAMKGDERRYYTTAESDGDLCFGLSSIIALNGDGRMSVAVYPKPSAESSERNDYTPEVEVPVMDPVEN